jgi:hypothetical protein
MLPKQTHLIDGRRLRLGGIDFLVPALSFGQLKRLKEPMKLAGQIVKDEDGNPTATAETYVVVAEGLKRNYPEVTAEDLAEILDLNNVSDAVRAILGQGVVPVTLGEAMATGQ